jgi:hypothetical protein
VEQPGCETRVFAENSGSDSLRRANAASNQVVWSGTPRCSNTVASRLLQFLGSLLQVLIKGTADEFRHRSARFLGQLLELFKLLFFEEECCPFHDHMVAHRHT